MHGLVLTAVGVAFAGISAPPSVAEAATKLCDGSAYAAMDAANLAKWSKSKMVAAKIADNETAEFRRIGGRPVREAWVKADEGQIPARESLDLVLKPLVGPATSK